MMSENMAQNASIDGPAKRLSRVLLLAKRQAGAILQTARQSWLLAVLQPAAGGERPGRVAKPRETGPLVGVARYGDVMLREGGSSIRVLAVNNDTIVVAERPQAKARLRLSFRIAGEMVFRDVALRAIQERKTDHGMAHLLRIVADKRIGMLVQLANQESQTADDLIRAARLLATDTRVPRKPVIHRVGKMVGTGVAFVAALALFAFATYFHYGEASFNGLVEAKDIELLRAERAGVFFPYAPGGGHVLKVGELVGVIDGTSGRSVGVTATCECYLGDFPVSAGSTLFKGAVLARLVRPNSAVEVVAHAPLGDLWQIAPGDKVLLEMDDKRVDGEVISIDTDRHAAVLADNEDPSDMLAILRIKPQEAMDPSRFGSEIKIRVLRGKSFVARTMAYFQAPSSI